MGAAVLRVGVDSAGGLITGPGALTVFVNGSQMSLDNDSVAFHSGFHANAKMISGSVSVYAEGKRVCRAGDAATCGHTGSPGSPTVFAG